VFVRELTEPISHLDGAGPVAVKDLANAGITSIGALLCRYPRDWEDRSSPVALKYFNDKPVYTVARVLAHDWIGFGATKTLKVFIEDETARAALLCYGRSSGWKSLEKKLLVGEKYWIWGKFSYKYGDIQASTFDFIPYSSDTMPFRQIMPVYPLTGSLNQKKVRSFVMQALDKYSAVLEDEIPEDLRARYNFLPKAKALRTIHFPDSRKMLEQANQTIIYEELFYLEIMVGKRAMVKRSLLREEKADNFRSTDNIFQRRLIERLPFSLTEGQTQAVAEISRDMDGPYPMARLLQGDVGSGKTLVAFLVALKAVESGAQAALMAPTELLARQHAENAARLLEPMGLNVAFLTGTVNAAGRSRLLKNLAAGKIDLVIGTHALFSRDVQYCDLRLIIIDEQHRFGVVQRQALMAKGNGATPDLLMMSSTPIPRTLSLTVFGDLDVSVIRDLPPGRKPVETHLARESNEAKVYSFVRKELETGTQAYFVYPLIEEGEQGQDLKDAVSMERRLAQEVFPEYRVALVHSKLDDEEKRKTMEAFRLGEIRVLVATSVVEVGVDVPNASCMVIEHAERFGLSALHQLRGRVGRGTAQSYCFLVYSDELTPDGKTRLLVMLENSDGFIIAEEDLKLRGPGQIAGLEQSGHLTLGLAEPIRDVKILEQARTDAFALLETDSAFLLPEHRCVAGVLERAPPFTNVGM
jgi:ATP-dependent DNA helicase RecG